MAPPTKAPATATKAVRFHAKIRVDQRADRRGKEGGEGIDDGPLAIVEQPRTGTIGPVGRASACHHCTQACPQTSPAGSRSVAGFPDDPGRHEPRQGQRRGGNGAHDELACCGRGSFSPGDRRLDPLAAGDAVVPTYTASRSLEYKAATASIGVSTIGSPFRLKDVLRRIGIPVRAPNASSRS